MQNVNYKTLVTTTILLLSQTSEAFTHYRFPVPFTTGKVPTNLISPQMWLILFHIIFFITVGYLVLKLYRHRIKSDGLIIRFVETICNIKKPISLIKGPLDEISKENNLNELNRGKLHLAIMCTETAHRTLNDFIEREKTDHVFLSILKSKTGIRSCLKEKFNKEELFDKSKRKLTNTAENDIHYSKADQMFMEKMISIIKEHMEDINFTVDTLCQEIGMSRSSLYHRIKDICDCAPADFIRKSRLEKAKELLETNQYTVAEIAFKTGFSDVKYFRTVFKKEYKNSPRDFSKENK